MAADEIVRRIRCRQWLFVFLPLAWMPTAAGAQTIGKGVLSNLLQSAATQTSDPALSMFLLREKASLQQLNYPVTSLSWAKELQSTLEGSDSGQGNVVWQLPLTVTRDTTIHAALFLSHNVPLPEGSLLAQSSAFNLSGTSVIARAAGETGVLSVDNGDQLRIFVALPGGRTVALKPEGEALKAELAPLRSAEAGPPLEACAPQQIRVLFLLTIEAEESKARLFFTDAPLNQANRVLQTSEVTHSLVNAGVASAQWHETKSTLENLNQLTVKLNDAGSRWARLRRETEADLVALVTEGGGECGAVNRVGPGNGTNGEYVGLVIRLRCDHVRMTLAHELGHTLGAAHEDSETLKPYEQLGYAFRDEARDYGDIMLACLTALCRRTAAYGRAGLVLADGLPVGSVTHAPATLIERVACRVARYFEDTVSPS